MAEYANLSEPQRERLEMLAEEAGEIVQSCMKILRHGYSSFNPHDPKKLSNQENLEGELKELWTIYERMAYHSDLQRLNFHDIGDVWKKKLPWTHHQTGSVPVNHPPEKPS